MRDDHTSDFEDEANDLPLELAPRNGVLALYGYGIKLAVERGILHISDGIGSARRRGRFARATHGLRRIVVVGHSGSLSLDALAWCDRLAIPVMVLDSSDGRTTFASTPRGMDDARLRRVQARASEAELGLVIVRELLGAKLAAHEALLRDPLNVFDAADTVHEMAEAFDGAESVEEARQLEAEAATRYWQAWVGHPRTGIRFARKDVGRIPEHWLRFDGRRSVLMSVNGNRRAERPVNAVLNFLYSLAELEAILACQKVGLDPGLGLVHSDAKNRASLALDLMEPVRPAVERYVLDLLCTRTFQRKDFTESPDGHVRLLPPLTLELATSMPAWANAVAPWAERVAHTLGKAIAGSWSPTAPLTGARRRQAQAKVRERRSQTFRQLAQRVAHHQRPGVEAELPFRTTCKECGQPILGRFRHYCPMCGVLIPGQGQAARRQRAQGVAASRLELERWRREHPAAAPNADQFRTVILPRLANVKLREIMVACKVAKSTASMIRSGRYVPAMRHWPGLADLAGREHL